MRHCLHAPFLLALLVIPPTADAVGARATLIEARDLAYAANYRNDKAGLRSAVAVLETLISEPATRAYAHYYIAWSYWMLSASHFEDKNTASAVEAAGIAVEHARRAVAARPRDSDMHTMLAEALTFLAVLDFGQRKEIRPQLEDAQRKALELDPDNPRALLVDAGLIFWAPPDRGGSQQRGLARWREALEQFEAEADSTSVDPVAPRWGHALSYGWMASNLLAMSPPQKESARRAAETALQMRPDFWYARERVLPRTQ